jgi:hypothetical protein
MNFGVQNGKFSTLFHILYLTYVFSPRTTGSQYCALDTRAKRRLNRQTDTQVVGLWGFASMPDLVPWLPWIVGALLVFLVVVVWLGHRDVTKAVTGMGAAVTRMDQSLLKMDKSATAAADAAQAAREAANAARDAARGAELSANACMAMVREVALWRQERDNPGPAE